MFERTRIILWPSALLGLDMTRIKEGHISFAVVFCMEWILLHISVVRLQDGVNRSSLQFSYLLCMHKSQLLLM